MFESNNSIVPFPPLLSLPPSRNACFSSRLKWRWDPLFAGPPPAVRTDELQQFYCSLLYLKVEAMLVSLCSGWVSRERDRGRGWYTWHSRVWKRAPPTLTWGGARDAYRTRQLYWEAAAPLPPLPEHDVIMPEVSAPSAIPSPRPPSIIARIQVDLC